MRACNLGKDKFGLEYVCACVGCSNSLTHSLTLGDLKKNLVLTAHPWTLMRFSCMSVKSVRNTSFALWRNQNMSEFCAPFPPRSFFASLDFCLQKMLIYQICIIWPGHPSFGLSLESAHNTLTLTHVSFLHKRASLRCSAGHFCVEPNLKRFGFMQRQTFTNAKSTSNLDARTESIVKEL